jgi:hypothetical protein
LFFVSAQKEKSKNGTLEYEPLSLKSIRASIHRYLKDKQYDGNIMVDDEFYKSRQALTAKFKELKSLGMGNQPNAADPLTDIEINKFLYYLCCPLAVFLFVSLYSIVNTRHHLCPLLK